MGLEQGWKLMGLANGDTKEQPSSETQEVEEHDTELKRQPLKAPLLLPLPSGQVPVREELGQQQEEEEEQQQLEELEQKLE